jgi:hypothetical protein
MTGDSFTNILLDAMACQELALDDVVGLEVIRGCTVLRHHTGVADVGRLHAERTQL